MLSDRVVSLLYKYEIDASMVQSDAQGWALISEKSRSKTKPRPSVCVCFSGLTETEKTELSECAEKVGIQVNSNVVKSTTHLCCDLERVGPKKLEKAEAQGVRIISVSDFRHMLETGEIL